MRHVDEYEGAPYSVFQVEATVIETYRDDNRYLQERTTYTGSLEADTLSELYEKMAAFRVSNIKSEGFGHYSSMISIDVEFGTVFETIGQDDYDKNKLEQTDTWRKYIEQVEVKKEADQRKAKQVAKERDEAIITKEKALLAELLAKHGR